MSGRSSWGRWPLWLSNSCATGLRLGQRTRVRSGATDLKAHNSRCSAHAALAGHGSWLPDSASVHSLADEKDADATARGSAASPDSLVAASASRGSGTREAWHDVDRTLLTARNRAVNQAVADVPPFESLRDARNRVSCGALGKNQCVMNGAVQDGQTPAMIAASMRHRLVLLELRRAHARCGTHRRARTASLMARCSDQA